MDSGLILKSAIKGGFRGVEVPRIRTLIIPGHCHEILKCCPRVTKVWCNRDNGSKLVAVIAKEVQEMRGFFADEDGVLIHSTFLADERLANSGLIKELKIVIFPNSSIEIIKAAPNFTCSGHERS